MKNNIYTKTIILVIITSLFPHLNSNAQNQFPKLGIIAELAYIKYSSENYLWSVINKSPTKPDNESEVKALNNQKAEAIKKYLNVKMAYDQILLQLATHLKQKNNLRVYKKLDDELTIHTMSEISTNLNDKESNKYASALKNAYNLYKSLIPQEPLVLTSFADVGLSDITGIITLGIDTIKDARDFRAKKVELICNILDSLRLTNVESLKNSNKDNK